MNLVAIANVIQASLSHENFTQPKLIVHHTNLDELIL